MSTRLASGASEHVMLRDVGGVGRDRDAAVEELFRREYVPMVRLARRMTAERVSSGSFDSDALRYRRPGLVLAILATVAAVIPGRDRHRLCSHAAASLLELPRGARTGHR